MQPSESFILGPFFGAQRKAGLLSGQGGSRLFTEACRVRACPLADMLYSSQTAALESGQLRSRGNWSLPFVVATRPHLNRASWRKGGNGFLGKKSVYGESISCALLVLSSAWSAMNMPSFMDSNKLYFTAPP